MYVLIIGRSYPAKNTGMNGIFEYEQAMALKRAGCKVVYGFCDTRSIRSLRKYGSFKANENDVDFYGQHLPIGGLPPALFAAIKTAYTEKVIKEILTTHGTPDVIHIHFPLLSVTEKVWDELKKLNRPIIVTEHWSKVQAKNLRPHRVALLKRVVEEADEFFSVGEPLRKAIVELTDTEREISIMPNMVSPLFHYKEPQHETREHYEFIAVGRLIKSKKMNVLIEAFTKAFQGNEKVKLTIVGGGSQYDKLERQITDANMEKQIELTGMLSRENTAERLQNSDAFVSASVLETFGVPFIEAMSCGKPVIGVRGGAIDAYIDSSNGLLFQQDNIEDLAEKLTEIHRNRTNYNEEQIAEKAEQFSERTLVGRLQEIYTECTRRHPEQNGK